MFKVKLQLSPCTPWWLVGAQRHSSTLLKVGTRWMRVVSFTLWSSYPVFVQEPGCILQAVRTFQRRARSLAPRFLGPSDRFLVSILISLCRLLGSADLVLCYVAE